MMLGQQLVRNEDGPATQRLGAQHSGQGESCPLLGLAWATRMTGASEPVL